MSEYLAVIPLVCVWFGGILVMLAEAFRAPGEKMPMEGIALGVLATAGTTAGTVVESQRGELRGRERG